MRKKSSRFVRPCEHWGTETHSLTHTHVGAHTQKVAGTSKCFLTSAKLISIYFSLRRTTGDSLCCKLAACNLTFCSSWLTLQLIKRPLFEPGTSEWDSCALLPIARVCVDMKVNTVTHTDEFKKKSKKTFSYLRKYLCMYKSHKQAHLKQPSYTSRWPGRLRTLKRHNTSLCQKNNPSTSSKKSKLRNST